MPPQHAPYIFDPFFRGSKTGQGTGLGLHLVASYVNQAQGMIEVSANQPNGSIFSLFIPMSPQ